jgi:hypothetical protein
MAGCRWVALTVWGVAIVGCGGNQYPTARVQGTVTCEGNPVSGGTITFNPIPEEGAKEPGKSASGIVDASGHFQLSTFKPGDGAIVGMHEVFYTPPVLGEGGDADDEGNPPPATPAPSPAAKPTGKQKLLPCQFGGTARMGVSQGSNDLAIELTSWMPAVKKDDDDERGE